MHRYARMVAMATAAALATGGVLAGGAAAAAPPAAPPAVPQANLEWGACPRPSPAPLPVGLECTTLEVPLDYQDPGGRTIEIAVSRIQAGDPAKRRGVLLLNPGGPGGSGLLMPGLLTSLASASVTERYDLIGFDPRGVGYSTPVSCGFTPEQQEAVLPGYARDTADVARRMTVVEALADQCANAYPDGFLRHITTANTARDMDRIRQALGEEQISYLGYSYGTYLGSVYAQMFSERTDRFILDSAVGPEWVWREEFRQWGQGGELAFPAFAEWVAARDEEYGLGGTPEQVRQTYFELAGQLDEVPMGDLDGTEFRWQTFTGLYNLERYDSTADLWQSVKQGEMAAASAAVSDPEREVAGLQVPADNQTTSQLTVLCSDAQWPESVEHYQDAVEQDREQYPLFGAMTGNMWPCAAWDAEPMEQPVQITERAAQNGILILQNVRDPATVLAGAVQLKENLGENAKLVRIDEAGHAAYLFADNACAADIATNYLANGELPDGDVFCPSGSSQRLLERADNEERKEAILEFYSRQAPL